MIVLAGFLLSLLIVTDAQGPEAPRNVIVFYNKPHVYSEETTETIECKFSYAGSKSDLSVSFTLNGVLWTKTVGHLADTGASFTPPRFTVPIEIQSSVDEGQYVCIVQGPFGKAVSNATVFKFVVTTPAMLLTIAFGGDDSLNCLTDIDSSELARTWMYNGETITDSNNFPYIRINEKGNVIMVYGSGWFTSIRSLQCIISDPKLPRIIYGPIHTVHFTTADESIRVVDRIVKRSEKTNTFLIGEPLEISCVASGHPFQTPTWRFTKPGTTTDVEVPNEMFPDFHTRQAGSLLFVNSATSDHAGTYTCKYPNLLTEQFTVKIEGKPVFSKTPIPQYFVIGMEPTLDCEANTAVSIPTPDINWLKNGEKLTNKGSSLVLRHLNERRSFMIQCNISNVHGWIIQSTEITYGGPYPHIIANARSTIFGLDSSKVILQCDIQGEPAPSCTWQKDGATQHTQCSYEITNPTRSSEGKYTCTGVNVLGSALRNVTLFLAGEQGPQLSFSPDSVHWNALKKYSEDVYQKAFIFSRGYYEIHCASSSTQSVNIARTTPNNLPLTPNSEFYAFNLETLTSKIVEVFECTSDGTKIGSSLELTKVPEENLVKFTHNLQENNVEVCLGSENMNDLPILEDNCAYIYNVYYRVLNAEPVMSQRVPCDDLCVRVENLDKDKKYEFRVSLHIPGSPSATSQRVTVVFPSRGLGAGAIAGIAIAVISVFALIILAILFRNQLKNAIQKHWRR